jgi:superfamily I DNA and/or RNA helicase
MPGAGPLLIISTTKLGLSEAGHKSKTNQGEAKLVLQHCKQLLKAGVKGEDIGIISPYKAQASY